MLPACKICCLNLLINILLLLKYAIIPTICSIVHLFYEWSEIFVQKLIKYCRTLSSAFLKIFCFFGSSTFGYSCFDIRVFWSLDATNCFGRAMLNLRFVFPSLLLSWDMSRVIPGQSQTCRNVSFCE